MGKFKVPNTYVIIFFVLLLSAVATCLVPGGKPQTWQVFTSLYDGFSQQAGIIVFVLIIGGAFWIVNSTKALDKGINKFIVQVQKLERFKLIRKIGIGNIVITLIMLMFGVFGAVFGMSEETIAFVVVVIPLAKSFGYDEITGLCMVYLAAHVGVAGAMLNPFSVGIAQEMADLPLFSGIEYRTLCWVILMIIVIAFVIWYASKIKQPIANVNEISDDKGEERLDGRSIIVLCLLLLTIIAMIVGVTVYEWYLPEISGLFMVLGISAGIVGGFSADKIAKEFIEGAKDIFSAALVIGFAGGIMVILQNGDLIDIMLNGLSSSLEGSGKIGAVAMMYGIENVLNFFIPSTSAKAALTMPIMAPFSELIGLSRQTAVLIFQFGSGITNMITPCSGVLMAVLSVAKIPYERWFQFIWKFIVFMIVICFLLLLPTVYMDITGF